MRATVITLPCSSLPSSFFSPPPPPACCCFTRSARDGCRDEGSRPAGDPCAGGASFAADSGTVSYSEFSKFAKSSPGGAGGEGSSSDEDSSIEGKLRRILQKAEDGGIDLSDSFRHFDKNDDGEITVNEFKNALKELGFHPTKAETEDLMSRMGHDPGADPEDATISYRDFIKFAHSLSKKEEVHIKDVENKLRRILERAQEQTSNLLLMVNAIEVLDLQYVEQAQSSLKMWASSWKQEIVPRPIGSRSCRRPRG